MTGNKKILVNEVGNRHLHKKHKIALEGSDNGFSRAKVQDQLFVDQLLMDDLITVAQHREAERIVALAQSANVYVKTPSREPRIGGGGKPDMMSSGLMKLRRFYLLISHKHGEAGVSVLYSHVIKDIPTDDKEKICLLAKVLTKDAIN